MKVKQGNESLVHMCYNLCERKSHTENICTGNWDSAIWPSIKAACFIFAFEYNVLVVS